MPSPEPPPRRISPRAGGGEQLGVRQAVDPASTSARQDGRTDNEGAGTGAAAGLIHSRHGPEPAAFERPLVAVQPGLAPGHKVSHPPVHPASVVDTERETPTAALATRPLHRSVCRTTRGPGQKPAGGPPTATITAGPTEPHLARVATPAGYPRSLPRLVPRRAGFRHPPALRAHADKSSAPCYETPSPAGAWAGPGKSPVSCQTAILRAATAVIAAPMRVGRRCRSGPPGPPAICENGLWTGLASRPKRTGRRAKRHTPTPSRTGDASGRFS